MAKDTFHGPLERVDECCWRIPRSYKPGMRVDGLIFASERLMEQIRTDQAPEQVANVAFLPGIQHASLAMPDIHWGYGFCIGGVCATDPDEGGVITPGGIGFDINCLAGKTRVMHAHGYTRAIDDLADDWPRAVLSCFDLLHSRRESTAIKYWFGQKPRTQVLRLTTAVGDEITATADHPLWTPQGMVHLGQLRPGDRIALNPFQGTPYEEPSEDIIVSEEDVVRRLQGLGKTEAGNGIGQIVKYLKQRGFIPLRYSSPALPYLCKIVGFVLGDGSCHFESKTGKGVVWFYGDAEDLEAIRADLQAIAVTPSRIYSRQRQHTITTVYRQYSFERQEDGFKVVSSAFTALLSCLGVPLGKKTAANYSTPAWLDAAPQWHRRLFLAAFFGAELTTPSTITDHGTVFNQPTIGMNKDADCVNSGRHFLRKISEWLKEFGVATQSILLEEHASPRKMNRESSRLRLVLSAGIDSLLSLWGLIGYEYNRQRSGLAALAVQYLKHKQKVLEERTTVAAQAREMSSAGIPRGQVARHFATDRIPERFVLWSLDAGDTFMPRVPADFPTFEQYRERNQVSGPVGGMVWESVASVEPVEYDGLIYDFTVEHPDHNFIADGFVVSNCGVRLVRSNLFYREVKPHLRTLVEELFREVPTGVGKSGRFSFDRKELKHLLGEGPTFLAGRGLATGRDIDYTEARGRLDGADPDAVSDRALVRGADQCGTLGSGNHFLEVQVVDHIFDETAAQVMGLEKDMICVMIHSGSRGLGYQVCEDALQSLRKAPEKYGIDLPDRQLACAPVHSPEGQHYIAAMRAAAHFAWCNRQLLMQQAREVFAKIFGRSWMELQMNLIYDVCHNIAKFEEHVVNGKKKRVWVHRKGATRAFPPDHPEIPAMYRKIGQPVIIPGDMGRASWVLVGQPGSMERTFGTTCHGAGRAMSRTAAVKEAAGRRIDRELEAKGIIARAQSRKGLAEEQPKAYKNVDDVVDVVHRAGLSHKVARMRPIGVIKG